MKSKDNRDNKLLPFGVQPIEVVELVEEMGSFMPRGNHFESLISSRGTSPERLMLILSTAELLDLVYQEGGVIRLTELGLAFNHLSSGERRSALRKKLATLEPFFTAIEIAEKRSKVTTMDIMGALLKKGVRWSESDEKNLDIIHNFLIDWAIGGGLLTYDGRKDRFQSAMAKYFFS